METEQTFTVEEMSCGHCKATIESAVGEVAGVASVQVDLESKRVVVRGSAAEADVRFAIEDAGYTVA